jgi:hypothetical protein
MIQENHTQLEKQMENQEETKKKVYVQKQYLHKINNICNSVIDPIDRLYCNEICEKIHEAISSNKA